MARGEGGVEGGGDSAALAAEGASWSSSQEPLLLGLLSEELGVPVTDILDFECFLYDTQKASISGAANEFLCSARLDNLASCFVATQALIEHSDDAAAFAADVDVSLIALFDNEEVGSDSAAGAGSPIMSEAVRRITTAMSDGGAYSDDLTSAATRRSFVLSADMAHAVHPNYASKHERAHAPEMNKGVVIKTNQNQRYASSGVTSFLVRELARRSNLSPPQEFVVRNDCPCGSTIGPIISANTGMRAVDLGMPQLSMHSIREMMGVADLTSFLGISRAFFRDFRAVDEMLEQG
jgi:aspartyl aminopeptidase